MAAMPSIFSGLGSDNCCFPAPWDFGPESEDYPSECLISNNLIHNIALELSVLYKTELKNPTAKKVKQETSEEKYQRTYHLYLGILITLVSGWFLFVFLWVMVIGIWELIKGLFS